MSKKKSKPVVNVWLQGGTRLAQRFGSLDEIESVLTHLYGKPSHQQRASMAEGYYRGKLSGAMDAFWQLVAVADNEQKKVIADDFEHLVAGYMAEDFARTAHRTEAQAVEGEPIA